MVTFFFALVIIFLVLAAQFESFRDPFIILIALPSETINTAVFWQMLLHLEGTQMNVPHYWPDCACASYCLS